MATEFKMPKLGEVMEEGRIVAWHKQEGERVERGENIIEVETDKATMEVESTVSGVVKKILVVAGETVPVNTTLALIE
ncbi:MAG: biotin attachment protein [Verrucomicrobia bacterium]|nr:biotin attachment protein [Verrucomicrobiota bacterium]